MEINEELFNKNGLAVIKLARQFSNFRAGDKIPNVTALAAEHGLSVGTTQYGLTFLKDKNVVRLISRGHLGTHIEAINYELLQEYAGNNNKVCVMPLPYSLRYEGLASAFSELGNGAATFNVAFMNGSLRRIKALIKGRYDCVLLSRLAAEAYIAEGKPIKIAMYYGAASFLEGHVLLYRTENIAAIKTLGVDHQSSDQLILARQFLKQHPHIRLLDMPYVHIIKRVEEGFVDATLWNLDFVREHQPPHLKTADFVRSNEEEAMTEAVLVVRQKDAATADFLNRHLQAEKVLPMLKAVLAGERIPEY